MPLRQTARLDRILWPLHRWVWGDFDRRVRKLIAFSKVEGDGGRDILRAAELTPDPLLRRLYLEHAIDELRHADLFRHRGAALLQLRATRSTSLFDTSPLPGGHGLDDLTIKGQPDYRLLAFLHIAEKAAAGRFEIYREVVDDDPDTKAIFEEILRDEVFHMNYTYTQLARIRPQGYRWQVWRARASRLWKRYLRLAAVAASVIGAVVLTILYFVVLAPFALLAKRTERQEPSGWTPIPAERHQRPTSQDEDLEMKILGISAHYHDSAAALVIDGVPHCAVQEERLSRHKNDATFPIGAVEWCLEHAGLEPGDLDAVVFYERSMRKFDRILTSALRTFPRSWRSFPEAIKNSLGEKVWARGIISSYLDVKRSKILFAGHHHSHAASALFTAPTDRAAILTVDGVGEWSTLTVGHGSRPRNGGAGLTLVREVRYPHSLGLLYSTFTAYLGFSINEDEYKVMGLAAYGRPTMTDAVRKLIRRTPDGAFTLDMDFFEYQTTAARSYSQRFVDLFGRPRNPHEPIDLETPDGRRFADCAASVQRVLEDTLVDIARALHDETGLPDLCLAGGVALNGVANARILAESGFERVFVPSAPGDAGCALGAALYADRIYLGNPDRDVPDHPFWGPEVDGQELARAAREDDQLVEEFDDEVLMERVADLLGAGRVIGWMDGASEFGPRALGHRSILAAPHSVEMRDRLNRDIKYREEFRPFAPIVPIEAANQYFDLPPGGERLARFMSGVFPVRPEWRSQLAAITHVDGSARLQTLERGMAPRMHALLEAYGRRTGIPVLLNTSFNVAGEPIVNRALEGYSTFRRCGMDALVAGSTLVTKQPRRAGPREIEA